jgi:hypothetical protein
MSLRTSPRVWLPIAQRSGSEQLVLTGLRQVAHAHSSLIQRSGKVLTHMRPCLETWNVGIRDLQSRNQIATDLHPADSRGAG